MKQRTQTLSLLLALAAVLMPPSAANALEAIHKTLAYAPSPLSNPLRGLVPHSDNISDRFPHSMEFSYFALAEFARDYDRFDWTALERWLNAVAERGHQAIFRVFLEYPGKTGSIPTFLIRDGLAIQSRSHIPSPGLPSRTIETPDYANRNLRKALKNFIAALGRRYDGDPRIGFITAGLLGAWGEWHDYPRDDLFADKKTQAEVLDAYESAFKTTPILVRYPAGENDPGQEKNAHRPLGYHDDSFAWATLDNTRQSKNWFFMPLLKAAGQPALEKWKTHPIGGEIRPEASGKVFDADPGDSRIQDFVACVEATHASWLTDGEMFRKGEARNPERQDRAKKAVQRMGYEFHIPEVSVRAAARDTLAIAVTLENRGVAPFYYDWPVEYGLLRDDCSAARTMAGRGSLTGLLPGDTPRAWLNTLDTRGLAAGNYRLALRVANPLPKGSPVRFANETQDQCAGGWLTLTPVTLD